MRPYRKKRELQDWILRKLGKPVISVLIDTTQIDDCIDQACDKFGEFAGGVGNIPSIILINPELVYFDGTGNQSQPSPTGGKWRKTNTGSTSGTSGTSGTPSSDGTTGCPPCPPGGNTAIVPHIPNYPIYDMAGNICPQETLPGPNWCGDGIPAPHCFTEAGEFDPEAIGPYWIEGDTQGKPSKNGFIFKSVYDVPTDVIAIHNHLTSGIFGMVGNTEENALFAPAGMLLQAGGSWGMQSAGHSMDNRWGSWMGSGGGFVDIVSWQLGLQYIEMFRQMFTVKINVEFRELEHKVVITPPPVTKGVICVECTRKVADDYMYGHQWVREYAMALALIQVGYNSSKYVNMTFPGGGSINGDMYLNRGDALREKLELQLEDGHFSTPPDFFIG